MHSGSGKGVAILYRPAAGAVLGKNSLTCTAAGHITLSRCSSEELVTICEAISNKLYLEGIAGGFYQISDLCCGLGEVVYDVPDLACQRN